MAFLKVRLLGVPSFLDTTYDYHLPEGMEGAVSRGTFVELPFGTRNRLAIGLVMEVTDTTDCAVTPKDILCPHSTVFHFSEEQVLLLEQGTYRRRKAYYRPPRSRPRNPFMASAIRQPLDQGNHCPSRTSSRCGMVPTRRTSDNH